MSTEFDREAAKAAITDKQAADPEFDAALATAHDFQLKLAKENHRHLEQMRSQDMGFFGRLFGGEKALPTYVAFFAMLAGICGMFFCWYMGSKDGADASYWSSQSERLLAFAGSALAYVFGRGTR